MLSKKRMVVLILTAVVTATTILLLYREFGKPTKPFDLATVDRAVLRSGMTGEAIDLDGQALDELLDKLESTVYWKRGFSAYRGGWA